MAGDASPHFTVIEESGAKIIEFSERKILDELSISELGDQLRGEVESTSSPKLILDFRNVEHLSSAALGMLITLDKLVKDKKGGLRLCNINAQIFEVFKITRLNKLFSIYDTTDSALNTD